MKRRTLLTTSAFSIATLGGLAWLRGDDKTYAEQTERTNQNTTMANTDTASTELQTDPFPESIETWSLSKEQWQARLDESAFYVLRKEGTERPFTSELNDEKRSGYFACAGCGLALFRSEYKYDSGTGWPSFFDTIDGHVGTKRDFKLIMPRTEYHCKRCGGHQGHVFNDGPEPTGLRYCNNGVALSFIPA